VPPGVVSRMVRGSQVAATASAPTPSGVMARPPGPPVVVVVVVVGPLVVAVVVAMGSLCPVVHH
jgi:hypothetical protein